MFYFSILFSFAKTQKNTKVSSYYTQENGDGVNESVSSWENLFEFTW